MQRTVRYVVAPVLAAALIGASLAPALAQAASPRWEHPALIHWAPNGVERTVKRGVHHEFTVVAHFRTTVTVRNAVFAVQFNGGLYAHSSRIFWGTVGKNTWHDLSFTAVVPSSARAGWYEGTVRMLRRGSEQEFGRLGAPFTVDVHVVNQVTPPPAPPVINWSPGINLGTMHMLQGQTITETVSFSSSVALTNLQAHFGLGSFALNNGLTVTMLSAIPPTLAAGTTVPVMFTISAAPTATVRGYQDVLYLTGSQNNAAAQRLWHDIDFGVDVDSAAPSPQVIYWLPSQHLGTFTLQQGQTLTETAVFSSSVALTNMSVKRTLSQFAQQHGVAVTVISTSPATTSVAANTPVSVTFTIAAAANAQPGIYQPADLHVDAATPTNAVVTTLRNGGDFKVDVDRVQPAPPVIRWSAHNDQLGTITLRQGRTVNAAVSFQSSAALTNVSVKRTLSQFAQEHGVVVTVLSMTPATTTVAANTPVTVMFSVHATSTARVNSYPADLHVDGSQSGSTVINILPNDLDFTVDVDAA